LKCRGVKTGGVADSSDIALAILAAGNSRRFGRDDKLVAPFRGKMLGLHTTDRFGAMPFGHKAVVASASRHPCADGWHAASFDIVVNERARAGMGTSVAAAARWAGERGARALIICLADMPLIPRAHIENLIAAFDGDVKGIAATSGLESPCPPAIFDVRHFDMLARLDGDTGARTLLSDAALIALNPKLLIDIDRREDLTQADI